MLKFMDPARACPFDCGAKCMLGCRCGAKWNTAEWIDEAVEASAEFYTEARMKTVLIDGNLPSATLALGQNLVEHLTASNMEAAHA